MGKQQVYYCVLHGDRRDTVFISDRDKQEFVNLLTEFKAEYDYKLYAFVLLESQVHLVLRTGEAGLDQFVTKLLTAYAAYYNKRNGRTGYVFDKTYESRICHEDQRLMNVIRYVHYLPVVFGHSHHPNLARWTSHLAYLGDPRYSFVNSGELLSLLAAERPQAQKLYQTLTATAVHEAELADAFRQEAPVIEQDAQSRLPEDLTLTDLAAFVTKETGVSLTVMRGKGRSEAVVEARRMFIAASVMVCSFPVSEVAKFLGVHHSYVSRLTFPKSPAASAMQRTAQELAAALAN